MIEDSQAGYRGSCPCPETRAANGSKCGARSAYTKRGGVGLYCYPSDISDKMLGDYKRRHGIQGNLYETPRWPVAGTRHAL
jgi:hypothetical protein